MRPPLILVLCSVGLVCASEAAAAEPDCGTRDVEYALTGTLRLSETPYGKGDGAYKVGPGSMVLRFHPDGRVSMLSYSLRENFNVNVSAFFSTMTIATAAVTRATPNACGVAAAGVWKNNEVQWATPVRGVRTDGTVTCTGGLCGKPSAPPPGVSGLTLPPKDSRFRALEFSRDGKSFTMGFTFAAKTELPQQTSYVALTGREAKRTCVAAPKPCAP